mgnify:CR=1 FL=1
MIKEQREICFGVAGFPPAFFESKFKKKRENIFEWLNELDLDWVELQNTYGVKMKDEQAFLYRKLAEEYGIGISLHAPYFITLASDDDKVVERSKERVLQCFELASKIGAKRIIFHPGHFPGKNESDRIDALKKIVDGLNSIKDKIPENIYMEELVKTCEIINKMLVGTPIDEVSTKLEYEVKPIIGNYVKQHEQLYNAFYHVFNDFTNPGVNIVGRNKILEQPEFSSNIEKIKTVFNKLEDRETLRSIEEDKDNNIKVYIGNENNIDSDVTVIKTKFKSGDEEGTIAIIGPKRMEYDRVVGLLEYMKENIER